MIRQVPTCLLRRAAPSLRTLPPRRLLSTAPPAQKSRSWKNTGVRLGLAVGLIYWYSTSNVFAEEASFPIANPPTEETTLPTIESIRPARRKEAEVSKDKSDSEPLPNPASSPNPDEAAAKTVSPELEEQEEEAAQQGAFNEETGEINWDCPCLGGMAHGPCGEQFRAAFSCFVFSKEEPKGMDCIDNFKTMQDCFREHPEIYGSEIDEEEVEGELKGDGNDTAEEDTSTLPTETTSSSSSSVQHQDPAPPKIPVPEPEAKNTPSTPNPKTASDKQESTDRAKAAKAQVERDHGGANDDGEAKRSESETLVPKAAHDARSSRRS